MITLSVCLPKILNAGSYNSNLRTESTEADGVHKLFNQIKLSNFSFKNT